MVDIHETPKVATRRHKPFAVELNVSPAYDFLVSIGMAVDASRGAEQIFEEQDWLDRARVKAGSVLLDELRLFFNLELWGGRLVAMIRQLPEPAGVAEFLELLEATAAEELFESVVFADYSFWPEKGSSVVRRALAGDSQAREELLKGYSDPKERTAVSPLLDLGEGRTKERLLAALRGWHEQVFADEEAKLRPLLGKDAAAKAELANRVSSQELVELATGGIQWAPSGGRTTVVLAPTFFPRPVNHSFVYERLQIFCYPIADELLGKEPALEPSPAVIRLYKALADSTRLKMLKLLAGRQMYSQEIAETLGLSKPTVHHHLVQLRSAGLVIMRQEGATKYQKLRPEGITEGAGLLNQYLNLDPDEEVPR